MNDRDLCGGYRDTSKRVFGTISETTMSTVTIGDCKYFCGPFYASHKAVGNEVEILYKEDNPGIRVIYSMKVLKSIS